MKKYSAIYIINSLLSNNIIDKATAEKAIKISGVSKADPISAIANQNIISTQGDILSDNKICQLLAKIENISYIEIDPLKIPYDLTGKIISKAYAEKNKIIPIDSNSQHITIATCNPYELMWVEDLEKVLNTKIVVTVTTPSMLEGLSNRTFSLASSVKNAIIKTSLETIGGQNFEQLVELGNNQGLDANEHHIVGIVDWILSYAFEHKASDIHFEQRKEIGVVRIRIDGVLHQIYKLPAVVMNATISRLKLLGRMDLTEKRRPQDGRIKTSSKAGEIELRLATIPTTFGEKLVARIFDPETATMDFRNLGFTQENSDEWNKWTTNPNGIILVTGPTGSGKTTTLYSTLKHLSTDEVNINTIEDPIEMVEPTFNQIQVNNAINFSFSEGVRALMRQDPDIIMIGEIRDQETAEMAIQSSLTGHLVLSTLHTNDATATITRLLDLGVPRYLLSSSLLGILAQRLVRKLCSCKKETTISQEEWDKACRPWRITKPQKIYTSTGCKACRNTGYRGRIGIYEMLPISNKIKSLISEGAKEIDIREQAIKDKTKSLRVAGIAKVIEGVTSMEEILKTTPNWDE